MAKKPPKVSIETLLLARRSGLFRPGAEFMLATAKPANTSRTPSGDIRTKNYLPAMTRGGGSGGAPALAGVSNPFKPKAQALLTAFAAGGTIPTSSDIPTYSETTGFANSSLNNATDRTATLKPMDAAMTRIGTTFEALTSFGAPYTTTRANNQNSYVIGVGNGVGYRFQINATAFDAFVASDAGPMTVKVNGAFLPTLYHTTGTFGYRKFTFGSKAVRTIEFYVDEGQTVSGFNVATGDTISAQPLPVLPKGMIYGDSYTEGLYTFSNGGHVNAADLGNCDTFPVRLREQIGLPGLFLQGRGGQGAVTQANSQNFLTRAQAGDFTQNGGDMDLVIVYNSINDWNQTAATVQANWQSILTRLMTDQPNAIILGFSGFKTSSLNVDSAHNAAFINAFNAVRDARRMQVWDGNNQIITIGGNDATYIAGDGIHLNAAGAAYAAGVVKPQLVSLLQSL